MRVAVLAESFLPHMNGVTNSVLQVVAQLNRGGHETLVIAPWAPGADEADSTGATLLRSAALPGYPDVRVAVASAARLTGILGRFRPNVVHLASPFVLGWQGLAAADALKVATVAVYQTDIAAYTARYRVPRAQALVEKHLTRLHRRATLTLAPSSPSIGQLERLGIDRVRRWGRGVDTERFAPGRRDERWRRQVGGGDLIVGYVGRLAPEKQVEDLRALRDLPGVRLVIVGDGPARPVLQELLPTAVFLGHLDGTALAEAVAGFDVFVHPGESETFGQAIQEALASGVPVVATGAGGPVDLVRSSIDGWLYRPGDLDDLRARVADLIGDEAKRRAFSLAAREGVRLRTWQELTRQLVDHYDDARRMRPIDDARLSRSTVRPVIPVLATPDDPVRGWARFVALGDSLTEGLCDDSRMAPGRYRGWADRLAALLGNRTDGSFHYANLAVRSRRVQDLTREQLPRALALEPDLVSIFMGSNDLVGRGDPVALAGHVRDAVERLRDGGCDVLLVTPVLPRRGMSRLFARRFAAFNSELRTIAASTGAMLLDLEAVPAISDPEMWAQDKVHLRSRGHRLLAYSAARVLGVPDAESLAGLDASLHADDDPYCARGWLRRDAMPWLWRRLRGRTAGDGLAAKHDGYLDLSRVRPAATGESAPQPADVSPTPLP